MNPFDSMSTLRVGESDSGYEGIRSVRTQYAQRAGHERRLLAVARFYNQIREGRRPIYELTEALRGERQLQVFNETLTPSDFSFLFGDIIDRQLLAQYNAVEPSWQKYCLRSTVPDFRAVKRFPLDGLRAPMTVVPVDDNYPSGKVSDGAYTYAVQKYGRTIPMAWETIVNDDLNAFQRLPLLMSQSAVHTEEQFVTSLICNANGFNTTFFSNGHKNIVNQANGAIANNPPLGIQGLQDAMTILMSQVDSDGAPIAVQGVTLVVPPQQSIMAQNLVQQIQSIRIGAGGATSDSPAPEQLAYSMPAWLRRLQVAENYYLPLVNTTNGRTAWYLFADPAVSRPAIEIGFLRGHEAPEIFRKMPNAQRLGGSVDPMDGNYDNDSVGYKIRHVLGGTTMDYRMAVASNGSGS